MSLVSFAHCHMVAFEKEKLHNHVNFSTLEELIADFLYFLMLTSQSQTSGAYFCLSVLVSLVKVNS